MTLLTSIFVTNGTKVAKTLLVKLPQWYDRGWKCREKEDDKRTRQLIQVDYEDQNLGSDFYLAGGFNSLYTFLFLSVVYSGGLPLLYPITALYCLITYWVDKFLLVKLYKKPPNFDIELA